MQLLNFLFGCRHRRTTFPQTDKAKRTYIACLKCGKEMEYSWDFMRILPEQHQSSELEERKERLA